MLSALLKKNMLSVNPRTYQIKYFSSKASFQDFNLKAMNELHIISKIMNHLIFNIFFRVKEKKVRKAQENKIQEMVIKYRSLIKKSYPNSNVQKHSHS